MRQFFSVLVLTLLVGVASLGVIVYEFKSQDEPIQSVLSRVGIYVLVAMGFVFVLKCFQALEKRYHWMTLREFLISASIVGPAFLAAAISQWDHGERVDRGWFIATLVAAFALVYLVQVVYHWVVRKVRKNRRSQ